MENLQQAPTDEESRGTKILPMGKISHEAMRRQAHWQKVKEVLRHLLGYRM
jgi:hypothetical protein